MTSPYLLRESRSLAEVIKARSAKETPMLEFPLVLRKPGFWRGCARSRDDHDPRKAQYERIAQLIEAGRPLEQIPEVQQWLSQRFIWAGRLTEERKT